VLKGIREEKDYIRTKNCFNDLLILPMQDETFIHAADIYRALRKRSITIRKPIDCMIASVVTEYDTPLLHNDRDFD
jgi:predicted nucleic acid-binding protein